MGSGHGAGKAKSKECSSRAGPAPHRGAATGARGAALRGSHYRDLLSLLQREALLAMSVRALQIVCDEPRPEGRRKPRPMLRRDAAMFRRKFLASLARQQGWSAGDTLDFQRDLQMYEEQLARAPSTRRSRKPFEAANHPFVDRCAFLLDSSFMEKARLAASQALTGIEELAAQIVAAQNPPSRSSHPH
jgi:hypothetical protein